MRETAQGLRVKGQLDLEESEMAREAWRSMKANRVGWSFGYLVSGEHTRSDGVRVLTELDLFEISITPAPVNAGTRTLSLKSASRAQSEADLLAEVKSLIPQRVEIASFEC